MKINIEFIEQDEHRYPTVGDWWFDDNGTLQIRATDDYTDKHLMSWCIVLHELIEVVICKLQGVSAAQVDEFDKSFEGNRDMDEAGDDVNAPYRAAHMCASVCERAIAWCLGVSWNEYSAWIEDQFEDERTQDA